MSDLTPEARADPFGRQARMRGAIAAIIVAALAWLFGTCGLLHDLDQRGQSPEQQEQIERNAENAGDN